MKLGWIGRSIRQLHRDALRRKRKQRLHVFRGTGVVFLPNEPSHSCTGLDLNTKTGDSLTAVGAPRTGVFIEKSAKERVRGKGSKMKMISPSAWATDSCEVSVECIIYGRAWTLHSSRSTQYVAPGLICQSENVTDEMRLQTRVPRSVVERGGAITVQVDQNQNGAWQIFPCGQHVCVTVQFQRGLDDRLGYVTTGEHFAWDRDEHVEKICLFVEATDWALHAPAILDNLANWVERTAFDGQRSQEMIDRLIVDIRQSGAFNDPFADAIAMNLRAGLPITIETPGTLTMLKQIYRALPADARSSFSVAMNWSQHHGKSDLNLYSSAPTKTSELRRLEQRAAMAQSIRDAEFSQLMQIAAELTSVGAQTQALGKQLFGIAPGDGLSAVALRSEAYCDLLNCFFDLAITTRRVELERFFADVFTPTILHLFERNPIMPLAVWQALAGNRHLARMIGLVLIHESARMCDHLRENFLVLLSIPENAAMVRQLTDSMVSSAHWRRCQWRGILADRTQRARGARHVQMLLDLGSVPSCMRVAARGFCCDPRSKDRISRIDYKPRSDGWSMLTALRQAVSLS